MRAQLDIDQTSIPPNVNSSYGSFHFYKFGVCAWNYDGYRGPVHWINSLKFCVEPEYASPTSFEYWLFPGVKLSRPPVIQLSIQGLAPADVVIAGKPVNPVTGKGMPLVVE